MSITASWSVKRGVNDGTGFVEATETITGGREQVIAETFGAGTDVLCNFTSDVSTAKVVYMLATTATLVETNSSSAPPNVFNLAAGVPYLWTSSSGASWYDTGGTVVTTDITKFYITNVASTDLIIKILEDPTP